MSAPRRMDPARRAAEHQARIDAVWPPARVEMLTQLFDEGLTFSAIGERMGVTKNTIIGKALRIGLKRGDGEPTTLPQRMDALDIFPGFGRCVYPLGHPREAGFHLCGAKVPNAAKPYCSLRYAVTHIVGSAVERAAA